MGVGVGLGCDLDRSWRSCGGLGSRGETGCVGEGGVLRRHPRRTHRIAPEPQRSPACSEFAKEARFYFPHNVDFRGRAYPMHPHLNHLGADLARGLLQFAEGRPLGEHGMFWLYVQVRRGGPGCHRKGLGGAAPACGTRRHGAPAPAAAVRVQPRQAAAPAHAHAHRRAHPPTRRRPTCGGRAWTSCRCGDGTSGWRTTWRRLWVSVCLQGGRVAEGACPERAGDAGVAHAAAADTWVADRWREVEVQASPFAPLIPLRPLLPSPSRVLCRRECAGSVPHEPAPGAPRHRQQQQRRWRRQQRGQRRWRQRRRAAQQGGAAGGAGGAHGVQGGAEPHPVLVRCCAVLGWAAGWAAGLRLPARDAPALLPPTLPSNALPRVRRWKAESPFQFLATCFEIHKANASGAPPRCAAPRRAVLHWAAQPPTRRPLGHAQLPRPRPPCPCDPAQATPHATSRTCPSTRTARATACSTTPRWGGTSQAATPSTCAPLTSRRCVGRHARLRHGAARLAFRGFCSVPCEQRRTIRAPHPHAPIPAPVTPRMCTPGSVTWCGAAWRLTRRRACARRWRCRRTRRVRAVPVGGEGTGHATCVQAPAASSRKAPTEARTHLPPLPPPHTPGS